MLLFSRLDGLTESKLKVHGDSEPEYSRSGLEKNPWSPQGVPFYGIQSWGTRNRTRIFENLLSNESCVMSMVQKERFIVNSVGMDKL